MKWMPSGLGAEPKKVAFLILLLVMAPVAYYYGNSDVPTGAPVASAPRAAAPALDPTRMVSARPVNRGRTRGGTEDFRPSLNLPDDFDLSKVDPTLRTELLAKLREVGEAGGTRSLFEFYTPPPPPPPKVDPIKVAAAKPAPTPADTKPVAATPPKPVAPPIPLKYFGYEGTPRAGQKLRALFVDAEDHFIAGENDLIRNRYRVVRIGTTSAEVEDVTAKNTQTIRIIDRSDP